MPLYQNDALNLTSQEQREILRAINVLTPPEHWADETVTRVNTALDSYQHLKVVAAQVQSTHKGLVEQRRLARAILIVLAKEITPLPSGNWSVKSHSAHDGLAAYQVNPRWDSCQCPDFARFSRGQQDFVCKHMLAYWLVKALEDEKKAQKRVKRPEWREEID